MSTAHTRSPSVVQKRTDKDTASDSKQLVRLCCLFFIVVRAPTYLLLFFYVCEKGVLTFLTIIDLHFLKGERKCRQKTALH